MRILVNDYSGHPFQLQLSRVLAARGHDVLHTYAGFFRTPHADLSLRPDDSPTLRIHPVEAGRPFDKYSYVRRMSAELAFGRSMRRVIRRFRPEVVLSSNTPLDPQKFILRECQRRKLRFVFWLQDLYGLAIYRILKRKFPGLGHAVGRRYMSLEGRLLRASDAVVPISDGFVSAVQEAGVEPEAVSVMPNWAPVEDLPVGRKDNDWAAARGLADKFCFLYSGTLGLKHEPDLLLQLAELFADREDVEVSVVSEGPGAEKLETEAASRGLANLTVTGFQPYQELPSVLASADVLVGLLSRDAGAFSVPSKVCTYLCAQRPLLLSVPENNLAAATVTANRCGFVAAPGDFESFASAAQRLYQEPALRESLAKNARGYAERAFDIERIADSFEEILRG